MLKAVNAGISIRHYRESDAMQSLAAVRESYDDISPWMVWCRADYSLVDAASWIQHTVTGHAEGSSHEFAIVDENDIVCGGCGVNRINNVDRFANIGYWVRSSRTGRGIAVVAVRTLIEWTFAHTELNRLEVVVAVNNTRSQRVAEKIGATREAILKQRLMIGGRPSDAVMNCVLRQQPATQ